MSSELTKTNTDNFISLDNCRLCPRNCRVDRLNGKTGFCGQSSTIRAARAALHFWEEPVLSGTNGSGAVFFSGCNLRCVFCQNHSIAIGECGKEISVERLAEIFLELQSKKANNINLVTGTPFIPQIKESLIIAKDKGLHIPIIFNCGGYESVEALRMLDGLVDIYLPDMKYFSSELSTSYSKAPDYFEMASSAIAEMFRQVGEPSFYEESEEHTDNDPIMLMKKGLIVRHLLLPGQTKDSKKILRYLYETYGDKIYISIMNQYTPLEHVSGIPELNRKVTDEEYDKIVNFAIRLGIENAFIQEGETADESFIPAFDYEGI